MSAVGSGRVALVGAGPGDPELITLRGLRCLERAEVVVYDALVEPEILTLAPADAERIFAGKRSGQHAMDQQRINELLVERARQGRFVVRLKGGDPLVFGRGGEEALALAEAGIPFEVVPGVTAALGAAACAGIPVTHRGLALSCCLVTGHPAGEGRPEPDWERLARGADTLVVYMGVSRLAEVSGALIRGGRPGGTPAAIIESGTTPAQRTLVAPLEEIAERARAAGVRPPAVLFVGPAVGLRGRLAWFEKRPLFGRSLVVLRAAEQASALADPLAALGARIIRFPVSRTEPAEDPRPFHAALEELERFHWVLFTSANGVRSFFGRLGERGRDARALGGVRVAAVGPGTAEELLRRGVRADLLPEESVAEGLARALTSRVDLAGRRVLLPLAREARPALAQALDEAGARVVAVEAYRTVFSGVPGEWLEQEIAAGRVSGILFASSSAARLLLQALGREDFLPFPQSCALLSIGPMTSETLRRLGGRVAAEASPHTLPGLVEATRRWFAGRGDCAGGG